MAGARAWTWSGARDRGSIEQTFPTDVGRTYRLSGWLSHHPAVAEGRAQLYVSGEFWAPLIHSAAFHGATSPFAMQWQPFLYLFRATGSTTTITVADVTEKPPGARCWTPPSRLPMSRPRACRRSRPGSHGAADRAHPGRAAWSDNSADETGFEIERRSGAGDWERIATVAPESTRFTDFGVRPITSYAYRVPAR